MNPGRGAAWSTTLTHTGRWRAACRRLQAVGHPTDKVELLILGGTWSAYRRDYQEWFIRRCFDAMNGVEFATLAEAQALNETALTATWGW